MRRVAWALGVILLIGCGGATHEGNAPTRPGSASPGTQTGATETLRTITPAAWVASSDTHRIALVLVERGGADLQACPSSGVAKAISAAYRGDASGITSPSPYQMYQSILQGEPDCNASAPNPAPVNFDTTTGGQWLSLPLATKKAAMQWYITSHPNFTGPCAGATPARLIDMADRYAAMPQWRNETVSTFFTVALAQNRCIP